MSESPQVRATEHVCGLQGFGREWTDRCPACEACYAAYVARRSATEGQPS